MPNVFISYRRKDSGEVVGRVYDFLSARLPSGKVFRDLDTIPLGSSFADVINEAIARADVVLVVMGPDWISQQDTDGSRRIDHGSDPVRLEIETALAHGKPIVPLLVRNAAFPREQDMPESIRPVAKYNALAVRPDPDFHADVQKLLGLLSDTASDFLKGNQAKLVIEGGFLRIEHRLRSHDLGFDPMGIKRETEDGRDKDERAWLSKVFKGLNSAHDYDQIEQKGQTLVFPGGTFRVRVDGSLGDGYLRDVLNIEGELVAANIWNTLSHLARFNLPSGSGGSSYECGLVFSEGCLSLKEMYRIIRSDGRFELREADGMHLRASATIDESKYGFRYAKSVASIVKDKMELGVEVKDAAQVQSLFLLLAASVQAASMH